MSYIEYLIVIGIASILISVLLKLRKKSMIDYVLGMHPDLSKVEKDVARHIYHRGGEVWDVEITEVFKLPETDVWRLAKKLEHKGIITIWKDGSHMQLVLKKTSIEKASAHSRWLIKSFPAQNRE